MRGDGSAVRDFLFVGDAVEGMLLAYEKGIDKGPINLGSGRGYSIKELVQAVLEATGRAGDPVVWDTSKPDGTPKKQLDVSRLGALGWRARIPLAEGLTNTVADFATRGSTRL